MIFAIFFKKQGMKKIFFLFALLASFLLDAQPNLVPNPSFEADVGAPPIRKFNWNRYADWKTDSLYTRPGNADILTKSWWQPTAGTPDYLNTHSSYLLGFRTKTARTGSGRMAIIGGLAKHSLVSWLFYQDTYAEYIECRLIKPLEAGKMYSVRYYVALDEKSNFASNHFGAAITKDCVMVSGYHASMWGADPYAQVIASDDHYITSDEGWVLVCDTFIAKGGETFLTLGSFAGDFPKRVHDVKKSQHGSLRVAPFNKYAYYYIDDVSLTEVLPGQPLCNPPRDSVARDNIVFLIDASSSMSAKGLLEEAKAGILPLANALPPGDIISVVSYSDLATVLVDHVPASDTASIRKGLEQLKPGGGTNVVSGFNTAYSIIRATGTPGLNSKIIVLTDGKIHVPPGQQKKIIAASENENIHVSVVFFGEEIPEDVVKFAEDAGGSGSTASKGNTDQALAKVVPPHVTDSPYGERNAGKIALWEMLTKLLFPAILTGVVLKALRVI